MKSDIVMSTSNVITRHIPYGGPSRSKLHHDISMISVIYRDIFTAWNIGDKGMSFVLMITLFSREISCLITVCTVIVFPCHKHVFRYTRLVNSICQSARCILRLTVRPALLLILYHAFPWTLLHDYSFRKGNFCAFLLFKEGRNFRNKKIDAIIIEKTLIGNFSSLVIFCKWIYERQCIWTAVKDMKKWLIIAVIHINEAVVKLKPALSWLDSSVGKALKIYHDYLAMLSRETDLVESTAA